jgi:hypothetical protein
VNAKRRALPLLFSLLTLLPACEDKRRHQVSHGLDLGAASAPLPASAGPAEVAKAMVEALADVQIARAGGLGTPEARAAYDTALGRVSSLAAREDIFRQAKAANSLTIPRNIDADAAMTLIAESWTSMLAHYAGGARFETLRVQPDQPRTLASVYLELERPEEARQLGEFRSLLMANPPGGADGKPAPAHSPAFDQALRDRCIQAGFNPPARLAVRLRLIRVGEAWRVSNLELGPALAGPHPPTTQQSMGTAGKPSA